MCAGLSKTFKDTESWTSRFLRIRYAEIRQWQCNCRRAESGNRLGDRTVKLRLIALILALQSFCSPWLLRVEYKRREFQIWRERTYLHVSIRTLWGYLSVLTTAIHWSFQFLAHPGRKYATSDSHAKLPRCLRKINRLSQRNTVESRLYVQVRTQKIGRTTERDVQVNIIFRITLC